MGKIWYCLCGILASHFWNDNEDYSEADLGSSFGGEVTGYEKNSPEKKSYYTAKIFQRLFSIS